MKRTPDPENAAEMLSATDLNFAMICPRQTDILHSSGGMVQPYLARQPYVLFLTIVHCLLCPGDVDKMVFEQQKVKPSLEDIVVRFADSVLHIVQRTALMVLSETNEIPVLVESTLSWIRDIRYIVHCLPNGTTWDWRELEMHLFCKAFFNMMVLVEGFDPAQDGNQNGLRAVTQYVFGPQGLRLLVAGLDHAAGHGAVGVGEDDDVGKLV